MSKVLIKEDPDTLSNGSRYFEGVTLPFGVYENLTVVVGGVRKVHTEIDGGDFYAFEYAGRIWMDQLIISFWYYPKRNEIGKVLLNLYNAIEEKHPTLLSNLSYQEFLSKLKIDCPIQKVKYEGSPNYGKWQIIPLLKYYALNLDKLTVSKEEMEELRRMHLMSAAEKRDSNQMKNARQADIEIKGKKFGQGDKYTGGNSREVPQAEYNYYKRYGMGESILVTENTAMLLEDLRNNIAYHGSDVEVDKLLVSKTKNGLYLTNRLQNASTFGKYIYKVEFDFKKPYIYNANGSEWDDLPITKKIIEDGYRGKELTTDLLCKWILKNGKYDSLIMYNLVEAGNENGVNYVALKQNQIKTLECKKTKKKGTIKDNGLDVFDAI